MNVFAGGQVLDERMLRAMLLSTGAAMEPQYIRPATAKEMVSPPVPPPPPSPSLTSETVPSRRAQYRQLGSRRRRSWCRRP